MKKLLLISIALIGLSCTPEDDCGCVMTIYTIDNYVELDNYKVEDVINVPCQNDQIQRVDDETYFIVLCN